MNYFTRKMSIRQELKSVPLPEDCYNEKDCNKAISDCEKLINKYKKLDMEIPTSLFNRFNSLLLKSEKISQKK